MSGEVLAAAAAAAAARSLDELLLSHGAEGRSSGNLKYPLKQQKAHSLVLTQIIQPGTRSRKTAREGEKSLSPPPSGTVRLHVSYFTPPEMRCNFPSPFQQSLVNTVCGETRASPAFPQSRAGAGEPGHGAGAGHRTPCRGRQKQKPPDGAVALAAAVALPGPQTLLPGGVGVAAEGPLCCAAAAARGAHGQPHAAASAEDSPAAAADRMAGDWHCASGRRDAAPSGLRRHRSNLGEGQAGGPRRSCRATGVGGAQRSPGPAPPRRTARKVSRRAGPRMRAGAAAGAVPAGPEPGCGWSALGCWRAGLRRESPGLCSACLETLRTLKGLKKWPLVQVGGSAKSGVGACVVLPVLKIHPVCT